MKFLYAAAILFTALKMGFGETENGAPIKIERDPLAVGSHIEVGQIIDGTGEDFSEISGSFLQRIGVDLTQKALLYDKLKIAVGVGGLFWFPYPPAELAYTRNRKFGPGISQAQGKYYFKGFGRGPFLQFGYFPVKYNKSAVNLGEYLFRSGVYPGYIKTGGWHMIGKSSFMAQGIRFHLPMMDGAFKHNFVMFMETSFAPMGDISPGYYGNFKAGPLDFGFGASFHHLISLKPSETSPKGHVMSTWIKAEGLPPLPVILDTTLFTFETGRGPRMLLSPTGDSIVDPSTITITQPASPAGHWEGILRDYKNLKDTSGRKLNVDSVDVLGQRVFPREEMYYSHSGVKLMARMDIDFKWFMPRNIFGDNDLVVFVEAALLGIKDYPFYYDNIRERLPVMFGINLPAFNLLDVLALQFEHYSSPFNGGIKLFYDELQPVWSYANDGLNFANFSPYHKDDWQWSVYAERDIVPGITLKVQFSNDHFRTKTWNAEKSKYPISQSFKEWFYILRVEFGY